MTKSSDKINTRERLLLASLKTFGHRDYDAVSTREIVEAAGANISAISYHFGGKKALYLATAEYLADSVHVNLRGQMNQTLSAAKHADAEQLPELLTNYIHGLCRQILLEEISEHAAGFIFREQLQPTEAFDILYEKLIMPTQQVYAALVARMLDCAPEDDRIVMLTHSLMGQIINFRIAKTTVLRRLNKPSYSHEIVTDIADLICKLTLSSLAAQQAGKQND